MSDLDSMWIEFSIREIATQGHFALLSWEKIQKRELKSIDDTYMTIHAFLVHAGNISKILASPSIDSGAVQAIAKELGIPPQRFKDCCDLRNDLEHYDERLKRWLRDKGPAVNIGDFNVGSKKLIKASNFIFVRHYDPDALVFTFTDRDVDLELIASEVKNAKDSAENWLSLYR